MHNDKLLRNRSASYLLGAVCLLIPAHTAQSNRAPEASADPAPISVHVLDTMSGKPAVGLAVVLARKNGEGWKEVARGQTNETGRIAALLPPEASLVAGVYRITFATGDYFAARGLKTFYPEVPVVFEVTEPRVHHHLPLILSPHGYSTYRGS